MPTRPNIWTGGQHLFIRSSRRLSTDIPSSSADPLLRPLLHWFGHFRAGHVLRHPPLLPERLAELQAAGGRLRVHAGTTRPPGAHRDPRWRGGLCSGHGDAAALLPAADGAERVSGGRLRRVRLRPVEETLSGVLRRSPGPTRVPPEVAQGLTAAPRTLSVFCHLIFV